MILRVDWRFARAIALSELVKPLPQRLASHCSATRRCELILLDDFHWHIWQADLLLVRDNVSGLLQLLTADGGCLAECKVKAESRFWWQLPQGELAKHLKEIVPLQAFVPKYDCLLITESLDILNRDEKIVCRIQLFTLSADNEPTVSLATIEALRGYADDFNDILESLTFLEPVGVAPLHLKQLLLAGGLKVAVPTSAANYILDAEQPAETAICAMALATLRTARQYEQGIIDDIDSEFVHQYRVNLRKSRSLISLFKKSLAPERYQSLKSRLKILGQSTNDLRDLDVLLLGEKSYREMLPEDLQPGLKQLYSRIKRRRTTTWKKVVASLNCAAQRAELEELEQILQAEPDFTGKSSRTAIKELVSQKILAQYQRICSAGTVIQPETPDDVVHALRIECKKLRYLLELFSQLFARKNMKQLVRRLKILQDNLGRFNDDAVQREFLLSFTQGRNISREQHATINGLSALLYHKQHEERRKLKDNITSFTNETIRQQFQHLCARQTEESSAE